MYKHVINNMSELKIKHFMLDISKQMFMSIQKTWLTLLDFQYITNRTGENMWKQKSPECEKRCGLW